MHVNNRTRWLPGLAAPLLLAAAAQAGDSLPELNQPAPDWVLEHWMNSEPLSLADLAGDVVLARWWTAPYCPYCSASAPALNRWHETYADEGLRVIGVYHHKVSGPLSVDEVRRYADRLGFRFPVAIDHDWVTLKRWWLAPAARRHWTSVTFVLDRQGVVRHIHPGGEYVQGDEAHARMEAVILRLLAEAE